jgi:L-fuconolactonase
MMIVEWNEHMFSPDVKRYPFHRDAPYTPGISRLPDDPLEAYLERMAEEHIDRAVLVQPGPYVDDHSLILDCLERESRRLKGTSLFNPENPDAPRKLEELVAGQPHIIATRFHATGSKGSDLNGVASPRVHALWERAGELGLIIELHIGPSYALDAAAAIRAHPEFTVLIDHLAEPHMGDAVEYAHVLDLASFDNVYMKLSGLNHFSSDAPLYLEAWPFTRRVIDAFGPDRLVWGSGTPRIVDAHMEGFSENERMKVKGDNLMRLLDW